MFGEECLRLLPACLDGSDCTDPNREAHRKAGAREGQHGMPTVVPCLYGVLRCNLTLFLQRLVLAPQKLELPPDRVVAAYANPFSVKRRSLQS